MSLWGERIAAPALAAAAAAWWGIGLTVLQPLTEPEKPWTALSVGNNAYWARDVRWTMILLALAAFVWACRGNRARSCLGAIAALGWIGLDLWLDRIDLVGPAAAWWTAGAASAVAAAACVAARARQPRPSRTLLVVAASVAAVSAGVMGAVQSPSDTELGLAWSGYAIAGTSIVLALGCAASASPERHRRVAVTLALVGACAALTVLMWQPFPGEPARGWAAWCLSTILLSAVLTRVWTPPGGLAGYALTPIVAGAGLTVLTFMAIPLVVIGLGAPFTFLAGNPPVNGADTDSVNTLLTLVLGPAIGAVVSGAAFRDDRDARADPAGAGPLPIDQGARSIRPGVGRSIRLRLGQERRTPMEYTRLGASGLKVSRIALGCMSFGHMPEQPDAWALDEAAAEPLFRQAVELGITFWDTANMYWAGSSEELVGRAIRKYTRREDVVLATKVFFKMHDGPGGSGLSRKAVLEQVDASLERLGTDYVDLYQIHRFDPATPVEETMEALHDVVKMGKARYIGASSMWAWQFAKMQHTAEANGWTRFVSMQDQYNLMQREEEREMFGLLADQGVGSLPWSPLAKGRLARPWGERTARSENDPMGARYDGDRDRPIVEAVGRIAEERGVPMAQIALAWMLGKPVVTAPIVGPTKSHHLPDAAAAVEIELTDDEIAALEEPYTPRLPTAFS